MHRNYVDAGISVANPLAYCIYYNHYLFCEHEREITTLNVFEATIRQHETPKASNKETCTSVITEKCSW